MSIHIFGAILTSNGCAANNRGETEGNITTLQKLLWNGDVHTTVSSEAIRWGIRYHWQTKGIPVNRQWDNEKNIHLWKDAKWEGWNKKEGSTYIDDDVLGFMKAEAAGKEGGKGSTNVRRGVLEVSRAISLVPYAGDISFNSKSGEKDRTSLYGTEIHCTRYQYGFAMSPQRLREPERCLQSVDAICSLTQVGGNHGRYLFDFSPESIVLRISHDPAPRILYCFEEKNGEISLDNLLYKINSGDIPANEVFIGGKISQDPKIQKLKNLGCCENGISQAKEKVSQNLQKMLKESSNG